MRSHVIAVVVAVQIWGGKTVAVATAWGGDSKDNGEKHTYMHREGMLNQDKLEDLVERQQEEENNGKDNDDVAAATKGEEVQMEYTLRVCNFYLFSHYGDGKGGLGRGGGGGAR
jgi:hypothetical protein